MNTKYPTKHDVAPFWGGIITCWILAAIHTLIGLAFLVSMLYLLLRARKDKYYEVLLFQDSVFSTVVAMLFGWTLIVIDLAVLVGRGIWHAWFTFKDSMSYALTEMKRGLTG